MSKLKRIAVFLTAIALLVSLSGPAFATGSESVPAGTIERTRLQEVVSLRETNSETYLMSDGTYQCVVYAEDKYYRDSENELQLIDNSIKLDTSAVLSTDRKYKNTANAFDVSFSNSQVPEISIEYQGTKLTFSAVSLKAQKDDPLATKGSAVSVGAVKNCDVLSKLTYTGSNTITYSGVFANTDLVYVLDNYALKEYIVLKDNSAPNKFTFRFSMNGLTMKNLDGKTFFVDDSGTAVFTLDALFAVDANDVMTEALTYEFTPVKGSTDVNVTITLDPNYLSAKDRAFPVVIEPTKILIKSVNTADACVCSGYPSTNYQMAYQLRTGYDTDYGRRRTYIRFDIPTSVPAGGVTISILYLKKLSGAAPTLRAYRCTGSWSSATITWNNMPGYTTTGASDTSVPWEHDNIWQKMIVTSIVQGWVNGTYSNYGFVVKDITESNPDLWTTYYSSDAETDHRPELRIDYTQNVTPEPPSVNLILQYDVSYVDKYSDVSNRVLSIAEELQQFYHDNFELDVNIVSPSTIWCYAENSDCVWEADSYCSHGGIGTCHNSERPENSAPVIYELHHTNLYNILCNISQPTNSYSVKMVFIGHDTCYEDGGWGCIRNSGPGDLTGLAYEHLGTMVIANPAGGQEEIVTAIHEIGHMFGIEDHYASASGNSGYSDNCLYGAQHFNMTTVKSIKICQGCRNDFQANINKYSN